jgi:undecaprenyl-diphosphatase
LNLGTRFVRRAVMRGSVAAAMATAGARLVRQRPGRAALVAFVTGAAIELPDAAPGLAAAGLAGVLLADDPVRGTASGAAGAAIALATQSSWPVAPRPAEIGASPGERVDAAAFSTGEGVVAVVNAVAGSSLGGNGGDGLTEHLPAAEVVELDDPERLGEVVDQAAARAEVLVVAGGDGTVNCAAEAAVRHGVPLAVVPAGTLNHLARDLGLTSVDDTVAALRDGTAVSIDVGVVDGRPFLNTASFGSYPELVDARERLETTIGKWPAVAVALATVLRRATPIEVEIDGRRRRLWMVFVGNGRYHPSGFAPSWRERLDDGLLDVRMVDGEHPFARVRLLLAVLTGRLGRSRVYEQTAARSIHVRSLDGPLRLARDGETFDGDDEFVIEKQAKALTVYVPTR